jgi:6-phosphogluconolactonase/glucosamine-6-phosphate isomerase/deaminase
VAGEKKRDILARVLANDMTLPAARVVTGGSIHIFADREAIASWKCGLAGNHVLPS